MHFHAVRTCSAEWRVLRVYAKNENNHAEDGKSIRIRRDLCIYLKNEEEIA